MIIFEINHGKYAKIVDIKLFIKFQCFSQKF